MVPNRSPNLIRIRNPKLRAAPESDGVVIKNRRDNQSAVENRGHQDRILEFRELVAEPTVGRVPEEFFPSRGNALGELGIRGFVEW